MGALDKKLLIFLILFCLTSEIGHRSGPNEKEFVCLLQL